MCSALTKYVATGIVDWENIREAYILLSTCRYIIDPMSYATDKKAISDATLVRQLFNITMEQLQIDIAEVRIIMDNLLTNSYRVSVTNAKRFFKMLEQLPDTTISEKDLNLFV